MRVLATVLCWFQPEIPFTYIFAGGGEGVWTGIFLLFVFGQPAWNFESCLFGDGSRRRHLLGILGPGGLLQKKALSC
jgi:hypothetical protein